MIWTRLFGDSGPNLYNVQLKVLLASKIQIKKQTNKLQSPQRDLLVGWLSGDAELLWCGV